MNGVRDFIALEFFYMLIFIAAFFLHFYFFLHFFFSNSVSKKNLLPEVIFALGFTSNLVDDAVEYSFRFVLVVWFIIAAFFTQGGSFSIFFVFDKSRGRGGQVTEDGNWNPILV